MRFPLKNSIYAVKLSICFLLKESFQYAFFFFFFFEVKSFQYAVPLIEVYQIKWFLNITILLIFLR